MRLPAGAVDREAAARYLIELFRRGELGRYTLDTFN